MKTTLALLITCFFYQVKGQVNSISLYSSCSGIHGEGFDKDISFNPTTGDLCFISVAESNLDRTKIIGQKDQSSQTQ